MLPKGCHGESHSEGSGDQGSVKSVDGFSAGQQTWNIHLLHPRREQKAICFHLREKPLTDCIVVEVIDLTSEYSRPEVRDLTDDLVLHQEQSQQHSLVSRAADNPVVLLMTDDGEEPGDNVGIWPATLFSSLIWVDENSELLEEYEQQRRNITLRSQQQSGSSVLSKNDEDEKRDNDVAWPAGTIRCPICMDFYSEIVQSERWVVSTPCGHIFCSQCLPVALGIASTCPTCRTELTHSQYHPIYI